MKVTPSSVFSCQMHANIEQTSHEMQPRNFQNGNEATFPQPNWSSLGALGIEPRML
jgi:hypothetical protein